MLKHMTRHVVTRRRLTVAAALTLVTVTSTARAQNLHAEHDDRVPAVLVEEVRRVTAPLRSINAATAAGYGEFLGCVSGPEAGAMGVHYVNPTLVGDGLIDVEHPEALLFEFANGRGRLLGVEFIVDAATWLKTQPAAPVLEGQVFHYVGSPNRYGLPPFFELHVWAWRNNPNGTFADWNTQVSCDRR